MGRKLENLRKGKIDDRIYYSLLVTKMLLTKIASFSIGI